jgi:DNA-binding XRE family transcriptional regulator
MQYFFCAKNNFGGLTNCCSILLLDIAKGVKTMKAVNKEKVASEFGRFVREARERKGLIQADVAAQIGVSRSYYTMIESGDREIYFTLAINICRVLDLDINEFVKLMK